MDSMPQTTADSLNVSSVATSYSGSTQDDSANSTVSPPVAAPVQSIANANGSAVASSNSNSTMIGMSLIGFVVLLFVVSLLTRKWIAGRPSDDVADRKSWKPPVNSSGGSLKSATVRSIASYETNSFSKARDAEKGYTRETNEKSNRDILAIPERVAKSANRSPTPDTPTADRFRILHDYPSLYDLATIPGTPIDASPLANIRPTSSASSYLVKSSRASIEIVSQTPQVNEDFYTASVVEKSPLPTPIPMYPGYEESLLVPMSASSVDPYSNLEFTAPVPKSKRSSGGFQLRPVESGGLFELDLGSMYSAKTSDS